MAKRFDCKKVAEHYTKQVKKRLRGYSRRRNKKSLPAAVIVSGVNDHGAESYAKYLFKDFQKLKIPSRLVLKTSEQGLRSMIKDANVSPEVNAIMITYPLNFKTPDEEIMDWINPRKDIEGLHSENIGLLVKYRRTFNGKYKHVVPTTAKAIVKTLQYYDIPIKGSRVTIVNRSLKVGQPTALMLRNLQADVSECDIHTKEERLVRKIEEADILISAVPDKKFKIGSVHIKPGAAVMDISYHQGNVIYSADLERKASIITDPKNRIGQVTRALMGINYTYILNYPKRLLA